MKTTRILYAIQGTGNGHVTRAMEIVPELQKHATVDVLISGSQWELMLPFPVKYRMHGMGFVFGKKGGVDLLKTYLQLDTRNLLREINSLPVEAYDLVISDFEPVSSWACVLKNKPCIALSNQVATLHPNAPRPEHTDLIGKLILEHYAPSTAGYGFHFSRYDDQIYTPIIRRQVRDTVVENNEHVTVYLPSYDDERILHKLRYFKKTRFEVFSKHTKVGYREFNFTVSPLNGEKFSKSVATSSGVICNAGFGTTAEALYLGKKLLVVPMKTQYEQACNAEALEQMGVSVVGSLGRKNLEKISGWMASENAVHVNYPDETANIVDRIFREHANGSSTIVNRENHIRFIKKFLQTTVKAVA